jgi:DnaK suppressor protein
MDQNRYDDLKKMLEERRRQILAEVQGKIRDVRSEGSAHKTRVLETGDGSEADIQEDIDFALIQMKAETLGKIHDALARREAGAYGYCFEWGDEIAERRLRALPFAVRCRSCEEAREVAQRRERVAGPRTPSSLFFDLPS